MKQDHNPERPSPEIYYDIQGLGEVALTYYNTELYSFRTPKKIANHIYYKPEQAAIFNNEALYKELKKLHFIEHKFPWLEGNDEQMFVKVEMQDFDTAVNELLNGGEAA